MTRINLIDPSELYDQHLLAEYREIFMVGSALQRSLHSPNWDRSFASRPKQFTLNKGHVKFFYDKGWYLHVRYLELRHEMMKRGMYSDPLRIFKREQWPDELYNDWVPTERDKNIVRERIKQKIALKPQWYRKTPHLKGIVV